jgi:hypothetical protein
MDSGPVIRMEKTHNLGEFSKDVEPFVWQVWLDFCYCHRVMNDIIDNMPSPDKGFMCLCGRSVESYPHWPSSTLVESFDMLETQMGDDNKHHRYLAMWWLEYVHRNRLGYYDNKKDSSIQILGHTSMCEAIRDLCPAISKDMIEEDFRRLALSDNKRVCSGEVSVCFKCRGVCEHDHDETCPFGDGVDQVQVYEAENPEWLQAIVDQGL